MKINELIKLIKPAGDKEMYSMNLYSWLNKNASFHDVCVAFDPSSMIDSRVIKYDNKKTQMPNILLILGDPIDMIGSRLSEITCDGRNTAVWGYNRKEVLIENWFEGYIKNGKCWLDPDHTWYSERWETYREKRTCKWCGRWNTI